MANLVQVSNDPEIKRLGRQLMTLRSQLAHQVHDPSVTGNNEKLSMLVEDLERQEITLAQKSWEYKQRLQVANVRLDHIQTRLPSESALLEFRVYNPVDFTTSTSQELHWMALLVLPSTAEPSMVLKDLGPVKRTLEAWQQWLAEQRQPHTAPASDALYDILFRPFEAHLKTAQVVYIAPDSILHLLPIEQLRVDWHYWIERQDIRRLQTGRDLVRTPSARSAEGRLVAFGGINFNHHGQSLKTKTAAASSDRLRAANDRVSRELKPWELLPASAEEVQMVAGLYQSRYSAPADVSQARDASESRLKALQQAPAVLHLSTHGFVLAAPEASRAAVTWDQEQPLLLSALALARANAGLQRKVAPDGEDGILYSLEILGLPLRGTELVVLSACKTAQGVMDYAEGVYGLVRAFRVAGAQAVLMTLWSVGDRASKEFMIAFYTHWLQQKVSDPAAALRQTKLDYIRAGRDPQLWAPYVLISGK